MHGFLCDLMAHAEWANAVFFNAWAESPCRDHEEMRRRVGHIVGVQHGFLSILRGETPGIPPTGPPPSFEEIKNRAVTTHAGFVSSPRPSMSGGLSRIVQIPWFPEPPCIDHGCGSSRAGGDALTAPPRAMHDAAQGFRRSAARM